MQDMYDAKLKELGYKYIDSKPGSKIESIRIVENLAFVSGQGPREADGTFKWVGRVGSDLTPEQGYQAARRCAVNVLGVLKRELGSLEKIEQIIKVLGFVNSADDFYQQPFVMDGFTDLMVEVFGEEKGRHARSAIGTSNLPKNQPVEVEMIVKINN